MTKWLKTEGDEFNAGDALCEMAVGGISIAYESDRPGVILEKLVNEGQIVPVGSPILNCAINKQAYLDYIDNKRIEAMEAERAAEAKEQQAESKEKSKKPDKLVLMREIKHLIQEGKIDEDSGQFHSLPSSLLSRIVVMEYFFSSPRKIDFGKKLQSLARKGDANLMSAFEASFDGVAFNKETFDVDFFLDNAQAIADESK